MDTGMRYVYEVYQEKSFSRAAEKLYISQPALSIAVRKVEASLGVTLFDRRSQPLRLTPAGEVYIKQAKRMAILQDELEAQLNDLSEMKRGNLRIGGTHYFNAYVLPPVLEVFSRRYPGVTLKLREASSLRINRDLTEGRIDVMISAVSFGEAQFYQSPVFVDQILLVVPNSMLTDPKLANGALSRDDVLMGMHLRDDCPTVPLEHFKHHPFLLLTEGNNLHERSLRMCRESGFEPQSVLMLEQFSTAYALSCAGMGVSFASSLLIEKSPESQVVYYKLTSPLANRNFNAIMRNDAYRSVAVETFLELIREFYPQACLLP